MRATAIRGEPLRAGRRPEGAAADPRGCAQGNAECRPSKGRTLGTDDELNVGGAPAARRWSRREPRGPARRWDVKHARGGRRVNPGAGVPAVEVRTTAGRGSGRRRSRPGGRHVAGSRTLTAEARQGSPAHCRPADAAVIRAAGWRPNGESLRDSPVRDGDPSGTKGTPPGAFVEPAPIPVGFCGRFRRRGFGAPPEATIPSARACAVNASPRSPPGAHSRQPSSSASGFAHAFALPAPVMGHGPAHSPPD